MSENELQKPNKKARTNWFWISLRVVMALSVLVIFVQYSRLCFQTSTLGSRLEELDAEGKELTSLAFQTGQLGLKVWKRKQIEKKSIQRIERACQLVPEFEDFPIYDGPFVVVVDRVLADGFESFIYVPKEGDVFLKGNIANVESAEIKGDQTKFLATNSFETEKLPNGKRLRFRYRIEKADQSNSVVVELKDEEGESIYYYKQPYPKFANVLSCKRTERAVEKDPAVVLPYQHSAHPAGYNRNQFLIAVEAVDSTIHIHSVGFSCGTPRNYGSPKTIIRALDLPDVYEKGFRDWAMKELYRRTYDGHGNYKPLAR